MIIYPHFFILQAHSRLRTLRMRRMVGSKTLHCMDVVFWWNLTWAETDKNSFFKAV